MGEEEGKLSYSAEMDDSAFVRGMNNIRESVHETANEVKQTGMTVDEFTGEMNKLLGSFEKMTAAVNRNTAAQEQVARAGKKAGEEEQRGAEKATEAIQKTTTATKELGTEFEQTSGMMTQGMDKLTKAAAGFLTLQASKDFVQKVTSIRGEFQKLEVAFTTMLGSGERAQQLMQELTRTAAITPFDLKGVADGAKQLLAYGVAAENVNDTLIHLGDIAAGLSIPLGDLVMLYGTTMTQGRMFTQDLRQFMGRGIPLAEELAKQFGVTKDKVGELVTAGKVGAEEFNKAIMSMSSEGGKFAGLMEAQSHTIAGQISNIEDAIDTMFNEIGQNSEGIINGTLSVVSSLVENYEKVGKVIAGIVATYGVYKAAVMTVTALQALQTMGVGALTAAETAHYGWLVLCEKAQKMLNATMLANPYVLVATLIAGVTAALWNMKSQQDLVNEAQEEYNRKKAETIAAEEEHKRKIDELVQIAGNESLSTDNRREAMLKIKAEYPELFQKYNTEIEALKDIAFWKQKIVEIESGRSITLTANELEDVEKKISELEEKSRKIKRETRNVYNHQTLQWERKTVTVPSLTRDEMAKLQQLRNTRNNLQAEQKKASDAAYMKDLTGVSNEELERQIAERKNLIAQMAMQEQDGKNKLKGRVKQGGVTGVYSKEELQDQLKTFEWEQNRRAEIIKNSSRNFVAESQKAYQQEAKALKELESLTDHVKRSKSKLTIEGKKVSEMNSDEFYSAVQKQQKALDEAKKKYEAFQKAANGGTKPSATEARKVIAQRDAIFQQQMEQQVRQAQQMREVQNAEEEARIAAIPNDGERERAEQAHQHALRLQQIAAHADELRKANYEAKKKEYEAANPGKKYSQTEAGSKRWQSVALTDEQNREVLALEQKANAERKRQMEERARLERQEMLDYIKEYGEMQERKAAVSKEYDEKIERESEVWRKAALERERDAIIQQLDMEALSKEIDWESIFGHLDIVSTDALKKLREQLKSALKAGDVDAQNAKVLAEKIREIEETITERTDVWASILPPLQKRKQLIEQTAEAQRVLNALYDDETDKMLAQQKARSSILSMLTSATGKLYTVGDLQGMDKEQFMSILGYGGDLSKASDEVRAKAEGASKAFDRLTQTTTDLNAASEKRTRQEKVRDALNNAGGDGDLGKALGAMFGGMSFTEIIEAIDTNVQSLRGLVDRTGASDTDFGTAVNAFADGVGGFTGAVKSLLNLDVIGAVNGILDGIAGFARMGITSIFGVGNVERMEERIAALSRSQEILAASIDGLSKQIENSSATYEESTEAYREALKVEEEWEEKQREKIEARSGEYANTGYGFLNLAGKGSFGAHVAEELRDWSGWDTFSEVLKRHGSESVVKSWGDFTHLTPEEMELLKTFAPKEWERLFDTDGHANPKELVDEYIERAGMTESLSNALLKKVTGYDFEGYLDAWKSLLKDLDSSTEDFAEHVNETIANAVLDNLVNGMFAKRIKNLQKLMADFAEGGYDERELEIIRGNAEMLAQDMQRERQRLIDSGVIQVPVEASGLDEMRDQLRSALLDMTGDAEAWGDNVRRIMFEALADDYVFSNPAYTEWLEGWEKRYSEVMDDHMLTQAERDEKLRQLQKEQEKGFDEWRSTIQSCADAVGYSTDSLEEDFSDMVDSIMDAMTDSSESVEDWAKSFRERILHEYIQQFLFTEEDLSHIRDNVGAVMEIMQDAMLTDEQRQAQSQPYLDAIEQYVAEGKEAYARLSDLWQIVTPEESPFSGLRETFADALVGMEDDAKAFRKRLDETLVRDLIDKNVLGSSFTAALDGAETAFSDFDDYVSKWNEKYIAAVASGDMSAIDRLMSELEHVYRDKMDASESYLERIRDAEEDITFSGMTDNWVSALMDMDVTAEDWAQEVGHRMAEKVITEMVGASMLQPLLDDLQAAFDDTKTWSQDFEGFVRNPEIQEALTAIKEAFPEYQSVAKGIMEAFGVNVSGDGGFSDLRGTFVSTLMDMDADAESFGKNIGKTMIEQMADAYLETNFKDIMKSVNEEWAEALSSGDASKLDEVRRKVEELYTAIGNDDVIKKLRNDLKELSESLSTPLDDIRSSFLSSLMDLDAKTEDYARSIADTFTEAFIDEFVLGDMFDQQLESWKKQFAGIMSDESMDSEERARQLKELKNLIADYRDQMSEEARAIQDLMGTSSYEDQQATMNMSDKATYEQMDRYLGVQMATLMATEQGNIVRQQILSTLQSMDGIASPDGNIAREVRGLMIVANGYLLDIKRSNRDILSQFGAKLDSISSKLSRIL